MPQIHLQTSSDLPENADVPDILEALVEVLSRQDTIPASGVKAFHSLLSVWAVGEGHPPGIAVCTISMLEGRTDELKIKIADEIHETLRAHFAASLEAGEVSVTLELRDMDRETYRR